MWNKESVEETSCRQIYPEKVEDSSSKIDSFVSVARLPKRRIKIIIISSYIQCY